MSVITSSVANYLFCLTNASWTKEVKSTTLSKEFMDKHGLKGSPKLSKQLLSLGLSHTQISNLLQLTAAKGGYKLWENGESPEVAVRLQGNSTHFPGCCQAVTNPHDPNCWVGVDKVNCKILEDKEAYEKGILSFITIGNPITEDGIGWSARAKLRHVLNDNGETIAYYLERFYGDAVKIQAAAMEVALLKGVDLIGSTSHYSGAFAEEYVWANIPSRMLGYQDSLAKSMAVGGGPVYAVKLQTKSFILTAYRSRNKEGGVYRTPVTKGVFNPQTNKMIESEIKPSRAIERALLKAYPNHDVSKIYGNINKKGTHFKVFFDEYTHYVPIWKRFSSYLEVTSNNVTKGYAKPFSLPSDINDHTLTVWLDCPKSPQLSYVAHESVGVTGFKPLKDLDMWESLAGGWAEAYSLEDTPISNRVETPENDVGYNIKGYDPQGYDPQGYDRFGYDRKGYDRKGYDYEGYDRFGLDSNGYDRYGRTL